MAVSFKISCHMSVKPKNGDAEMPDLRVEDPAIGQSRVQMHSDPGVGVV